MNFKTRLSHNNRILFVYGSGEVRQTNFIEVSYFGDSYVIAKTADGIFSTLLDLDGNVINENLRVVHRFQNGLLLTYDFYAKEYISSDKCRYNINYNVYSVFNADTRKAYTVNVIQSDNLLKAPIQNVLHNRPVVTAIKYFLKKPVYQFKDFIFTDIIDNQHILTGTILNIGTGNTQLNAFDHYYGRRIWSVVDIFAQTSYNGETELKNTCIASVIFKDAELVLSELVTMPDEPFIEDFTSGSTYNDAASEFRMYATWKKKSKWQQVLSGIFSLNHN